MGPGEIVPPSLGVTQKRTRKYCKRDWNILQKGLKNIAKGNRKILQMELGHIAKRDK